MNTFETATQIADHFCAPIVVFGFTVEVIAYGCKYVYRYESGIGYTIQPNIIALKPVILPDDIADTDDDDYDDDDEF